MYMNPYTPVRVIIKKLIRFKKSDLKQQLLCKLSIVVSITSVFMKKIQKSTEQIDKVRNEKGQMK